MADLRRHLAAADRLPVRPALDAILARTRREEP
jgi:hypothetical protein